MTEASPPVPGARAVVVRRVLPASPDVVYDEWLDPDALADWMCPRPARCRKIEIEPRPGGRLRIDIADGGAEFYVSGKYLMLDRPRRLSFTWSCSTWPDPSVKSVVSVLLEPGGNGQTLMTIEHTLLPPGLAGQHARGWTAIADQLAAELAVPDHGHTAAALNGGDGSGPRFPDPGSSALPPVMPGETLLDGTR